MADEYFNNTTVGGNLTVNKSLIVKGDMYVSGSINLGNNIFGKITESDYINDDDFFELFDKDENGNIITDEFYPNELVEVKKITLNKGVYLLKAGYRINNIENRTSTSSLLITNEKLPESVNTETKLLETVDEANSHFSFEENVVYYDSRTNLFGYVGNYDIATIYKVNREQENLHLYIYFPYAVDKTKIFLNAIYLGGGE